MQTIYSDKTEMHPFLGLSILALAYISARVSAQPYHTLVTSVTKHGNTSYPICSMTLNDHDNYVIDLDAPFTWFVCQTGSSYPRISCLVPQCNDFQLHSSVNCPYYDHRYIANSWPCYCIDTPVNPVTQECAVADTTYTDLRLHWTNGRYPISVMTFNNSYLSCAPLSLIQPLPQEVIGVASLSWASLSLINTFTSPSQVTKKFALCLPSSSTARGLMFFGEGPYYINSTSDFDVATIMSYTPLINNPMKLGYYINVTAISVNGLISQVEPSYYEIQPLGHGGVKLSTITPYTTLRNDIYSAVLTEFRKATKGIPQAQAVSPFGYCLMTNTNQWRQRMWQVPEIELHLVNGQKWTIDASNSMKQLSENVTCLAFVDGGFEAGQAVVIGLYQLENNFIQFDLALSRLGYSNSLLSYGTSCGDFNFTVGA